jgi:predicted HTH transcriptional regulator
VSISAEEIGDNCIIFIEILNPDDVVYWNHKAYKLIGTTSREMSPDEILGLSIKLPGADYSKLKYSGEINSALVIDFAGKLFEAKIIEEDLRKLSSEEILSKLQILHKKSSGILFGDMPVRVVHYDENSDILDQKEYKGLYSILSDNFIEFIQSWTRRQGTVLSGNSITAGEEMPYPLKSIRDSLANAVSHALYSKNNGEIRIELHNDRLAISNNCSLEAKFFINKWFSKVNKSQNKLLMAVLRTAKITDELGTGKNRIFRNMIEAGKKEPLIEFINHGNYGRWKITLYNNNDNENLLKLIERLKEIFPKPDSWRLATALVLWIDKDIRDIEDTLDEHYKRILKEITDHKNSPVILFEEKQKFLLKRWTKLLIIDGQASKALSLAEENNLKEFLNYFAYRSNNQGFISGSRVSEIMGLYNSPSERAQLSRLLKKWVLQGILKNIKKGEWKFINEPISS